MSGWASRRRNGMPRCRAPFCRRFPHMRPAPAAPAARHSGSPGCPLSVHLRRQHVEDLDGLGPLPRLAVDVDQDVEGDLRVEGVGWGGVSWKACWGRWVGDMGERAEAWKHDGQACDDRSSRRGCKGAVQRRPAGVGAHQVGGAALSPQLLEDVQRQVALAAVGGGGGLVMGGARRRGGSSTPPYTPMPAPAAHAGAARHMQARHAAPGTRGNVSEKYLTCT